MIRPRDIKADAWAMISAAASGDTATLASLLARDPQLHGAGYWYARPIDFAVREGHRAAVALLLDAGADPTARSFREEDLVTTARDRGHEAIACLLEEAAARTGVAAAAPADHEIHTAAAAGDLARIGALLQADPALVHRGDRQGGTALHRAVAAGQREAATLLLDRGADVHALHGDGPRTETGYAPVGLQPIDLALWNGPFWGVRGDLETARLLLRRGATCDTAIASALGDLARVRARLAEDPARVDEARPCGKRALSAAVEFGHVDIVRLLLARGADPNASEGPAATRGSALYAAARQGDRELVELLLTHGADPNAGIDSGGSATYAARTPELRALLFAHGGRLDAYDLVWLDEDEEVLKRIAADPSAADEGCGGVFAAACTRGRRDLVVKLLEAGARVPGMVTACRSYLWSEPELLRLLLASGMDPDLPDWQHATPLHALCGRDSRGQPHPHRLECAAAFLDAGARLDARDEAYRSTPLAWAARNDLPDMVELLLARGAAVRLADDPAWATPLAWATRRGHTGVVALLQKAGATA